MRPLYPIRTRVLGSLINLKQMIPFSSFAVPPSAYSSNHLDMRRRFANEDDELFRFNNLSYQISCLTTIWPIDYPPLVM